MLEREQGKSNCLASSLKMLLYHRACLVWLQKGAGIPQGCTVVMLSGAAAPGQTMSHVLVALSHHLQVTSAWDTPATLQLPSVAYHGSPSSTSMCCPEGFSERFLTCRKQRKMPGRREVMQVAACSAQGWLPPPGSPSHLLPSCQSSLPAFLPALLHTGARYSRLRVYQRDSAAQPAGKQTRDPFHLPCPSGERRGSLGDPSWGAWNARRAGSAGFRDAGMVPGAGLCLMSDVRAAVCVPREIAGCLSPLPPCLGGLVG